MPYIELNYNQKIEEPLKEEIKSKFGDLISIIPGKSENWLMVNLKDNESLYFKGSNEKAAIVKVLIYGSSANSIALNKLTNEITNYLSKTLNTSSSRVYVYYNLTEYWGFNGQNF